MGYPNGSGYDPLAPGGPLRPWIGANFWSRTGGPRMWTRYDAEIVRQELATLAAHGCNVTRCFCYWPDFVPEPERLDQDVLDRFADFLDAHVETGLGTIPTFIVGHMSGQNWDPAWRGGRDLYRDAWLVAQQAWFAGEIAARFGAHPSVVGWLVSNEMPLYGGPGTSAEIASWARAVLRRRARGGGDTAHLARRRRVGRRAHGRRQRLLPADARAARRLRRAARLSDGGRRGAPAPHRRLRLRARIELRPAGRARGVRRHLRLRLGRARGRLLPDRPALDAAGRRPRVDRLEQLRLRRPPRPGPVPPPRPSRCTSGSPTGPAGPKPQLHEVERFAQLVSGLAERGWEPLAGDVALVVPGALRARASVHGPRVPERHPRQPAPGLRRRARGRPSGRARPRARRPARECPPLHRPFDEADDGARSRPAPRARGSGRDRLRLLLRGQHREAARDRG